MTTINDCVVRSSGSVDVDASVEAFRGFLDNLVKHETTVNEKVGAAVDAVFDEHLGMRISLPALQSLVVASLGVNPEEFNVMADQVADYVRMRPDTYSMRKGKGGGVGRIADLPVKE